jgi:protein-S-isoprenylcysteine O-methyltransferase Ste14
MSKREHAGSFMLPVVVMILIPWLLMWLTNDVSIGWSFAWPLDMIVMLIGLAVLFFGLVLLGVCIQMFATIGQGTLAPWAPTQKLVVAGIYRYMRNPMITGVLIGLLGESIILSSAAVFLWFLIAFIVNHIYFIKYEEPGLLKRFGDEYVDYIQNVPRWLPRRTPWIHESTR